MARGTIPDKWSMRLLWGCAIGSVVSLYMVIVERQLRSKERAMADALSAIDTEPRSGKNG